MKRFYFTKSVILTVSISAAFLMVLMGSIDKAESCSYAVAGSCYPGYYCDDPDNDCYFGHNTIQSAVDDQNAVTGVIVCPGTYIENVVITGRSAHIFSESGPSDTIIIAADPNKPVFYLNQSYIDYAGMYGFTIKGATGSCTNYPGGGYCAGILVYNTVRSGQPYYYIGDIYNNNIMDNAYGIKVVDSSGSYFFDNFNDGDDNGWTPIGSWEVENSEYSGTSSSSTEPAFSLTNDITQDMILEVKANDQGTGGWQNFFIVFAYDDYARKAYWAGARVDTNKWVIEEIDLDTGSKVELAAVYETIDSNTWYDLRVFVNGNTVTLYADDAEKVSYTFPGGMPFGYAGLGGQNNHAHFDDFRITFYNDFFDIFDNSIINNAIGIELINSSGTLIYHNNIISSGIQASDDNPANNDWHHPTLEEGNYWSDYPGEDDGSGSGKHAIAGDAIGDTDIPHPGPDYDNYPFMFSYGWSCSNLPVAIGGTGYYTLQEAYDDADNGETIQSRAIYFPENLAIDLDKSSVTLEGGYDCNFTTNTGTTRLIGDMTINDGSLTIGNFILEK